MSRTTVQLITNYGSEYEADFCVGLARNLLDQNHDPNWGHRNDVTISKSFNPRDFTGEVTFQFKDVGFAEAFREAVIQVHNTLSLIHI